MEKKRKKRTKQRNKKKIKENGTKIYFMNLWRQVRATPRLSMALANFGSIEIITGSPQIRFTEVSLYV
jgi:hypothetical protein